MYLFWSREGVWILDPPESLSARSSSVRDASGILEIDFFFFYHASIQ